jgi:hypothetical protein
MWHMSDELITIMNEGGESNGEKYESASEEWFAVIVGLSEGATASVIESVN